MQSQNNQDSKNIQRLISVIFGVISFILLIRGNIPVAVILAVTSFLSWHGTLWNYVAKRARLKSNITRSEALDVLGLKEYPTVEDINASYRKLMQKNHPDQGGSEYFAIKLNQAKDFLLEEISKD